MQHHSLVHFLYSLSINPHSRAIHIHGPYVSNLKPDRSQWRINAARLASSAGFVPYRAQRRDPRTLEAWWPPIAVPRFTSSTEFHHLVYLHRPALSTAPIASRLPHHTPTYLATVLARSNHPNHSIPVISLLAEIRRMKFLHLSAIHPGPSIT